MTHISVCLDDRPYAFERNLYFAVVGGMLYQYQLGYVG